MSKHIRKYPNINFIKESSEEFDNKSDYNSNLESSDNNNDNLSPIKSSINPRVIKSPKQLEWESQASEQFNQLFAQFQQQQNKSKTNVIRKLKGQLAAAPAR